MILQIHVSMDATSHSTNQPTWDDYWKVKNWGYTTSYTGTSWDLKEDLNMGPKGSVNFQTSSFLGASMWICSRVYRLPIHCFIWTLTVWIGYEYAQAASRRWWRRWWGKHHRQRIKTGREIKTWSWWWFTNIFYFHPYLGEWSNLTNIFQRGWNHQVVSKCFKFF